MCAEGTRCFPVCPQFGARVCYCDPWETQGAGWAGLGQRAALGGPEGGGCPSMARGRRGGRCLPWAGNGKSFSSFAFRPRKARGGSWLRARGALLGLETIPCLGHPQAGARRSPVIIHPFPTALFGVFMQALSPPSPTAAPGTPCPTRPGLCYPGGCGAAGEASGREEGRLPGRGTLPCWGGARLSLSAPRFPHTSHAPQISWVSSLSYLCPQCFWGIPSSPPTPPPIFIFGTRLPSGSLGTTAGAPNPACRPKGSLRCQCRSPPLASPAGTSAAWLVAAIGHHPQPRASPSCPQCPPAGTAPVTPGRAGGLWASSPREHPPTTPGSGAVAGRDTRTASTSCCAVAKPSSHGIPVGSS